MLRHGHVSRMVIGITSAVFCLGSPFQAAEAHGFSRGHGRRDRPNAITILPRYAVPLRFGDGSYYYYEGRYYKKHGPRGYVIIPAPMGVVVPSLPDSHRTIVIDGVTYHEYDGVYYKGGPAGYTVVPIAEATPGARGAAVVASTSSPAATSNTTIVNVPNKNGSYTPVTLQLAGNGMYLGPQGEVYPTLPTTQQLQSMYGK